MRWADDDNDRSRRAGARRPRARPAAHLARRCREYRACRSRRRHRPPDAPRRHRQVRRADRRGRPGRHALITGIHPRFSACDGPHPLRRRRDRRHAPADGHGCCGHHPHRTARAHRARRTRRCRAAPRRRRRGSPPACHRTRLRRPHLPLVGRPVGARTAFGRRAPEHRREPGRLRVRGRDRRARRAVDRDAWHRRHRLDGRVRRTDRRVGARSVGPHHRPPLERRPLDRLHARRAWAARRLDRDGHHRHHRPLARVRGRRRRGVGDRRHPHRRAHRRRWARTQTHGAAADRQVRIRPERPPHRALDARPRDAVRVRSARPARPRRLPRSHGRIRVGCSRPPHLGHHRRRRISRAPRPERPTVVGHDRGRGAGVPVRLVERAGGRALRRRRRDRRAVPDRSARHGARHRQRRHGMDLRRRDAARLRRDPGRRRLAPDALRAHRRRR